MTTWSMIGCQDPLPHKHKTVEVEVDLSERHGYMDFAPVPERLWLSPFKMEVWDWEAAVADPENDHLVWCPARDVVSQTIAELGIWEPVETIALLNLFEVARLDDRQWTFLDIGAQVGWYSVLAAQCGLFPACYEVDPDVSQVLKHNLQRFTERTPEHPFPFALKGGRIGHDNVPYIVTVHPTIAKIDIEGAEPAALELMMPSLQYGQIQALLIECTPRFGVDVRAMADLLFGFGFEARLLPPKSSQYVPFDQLADLTVTRNPGVVQWAADQAGQINILFMKPDLPTRV